MNEARSPSFVVSVGEFAARLITLFKRIRAFDYIGVSGEISQWNPRQNGVYFTLKDASAVLECFAYSNRALRFPKVALGTAVIAYGSVRIQERRSRYELLVDELQLTGIGELYQQYEALKEQFRKEGLFDRSRKRSIPPFPRTIVLVSARGKGAEDFQKVMRERVPHVHVEFVETRVQGIGADVEIAEKLDRAMRMPADAIVLTRGGGSYEDLFAFNREPVVRAILRSPIPVITGIGHTADHHLADDVADLACETPSNAAQYIANLWQQGNERLARSNALLDREMRDILARAIQRADLVHDALERAWDRASQSKRDRLGQLERRLNGQNPQQRLARRMQRLSEVRARLDPAWSHFHSQLVGKLKVRTSQIAGVDPTAPFERGYAMILRDGALIRDAGDVSIGERIEARLARGSLHARVEEVKHDE